MITVFSNPFKILLFTFSLLLFLFPGDMLAQYSKVTSPDEQLTIAFELFQEDENSDEGSQLVYSVTYQGRLLIERSELSLELESQPPLGTAVKFENSEQSSGRESYALICGKTSRVNDPYNAITIHLRELKNPSRRLIIRARAFNDAVAFRYVIPEQPGMKEYKLTRERTEFKIIKDAITYAQPLPIFAHSYESEYLKLPISAYSHIGSVVNDALIGLPLLMEVPGVAWMAINEADLHDYSSMYITTLTKDWAGHWLEGLLAPQFEDTNVCVTGSLPLSSAWRIIQIGNDPGKLIESNILTNLNRENAVEETSWIKPGKASWNWWSGTIGPDGERDFSNEGMKYYIDFAAESGFEYMLIDAGWAVQGDITKMNGRVDIPGLVKYAKDKNVGIWIWIHYRDAVRQMNEAFPLYEEWGVAGLKIDFIERDDQAGIEFYYRVAEKAAAHHLMLDFHGSTKPTGLSRTYPNILGYEGVIGMEVSKGSLRDNPDCHLMLPFTRMLQGYMDYTPGGFNNVTKEEFVPRREQPMVMGTRAHHLAMYVVYEAPFQMVSDHPGAYEGQPSFQFIKDVPASWDETKVLNGIPGEYITIARRKGDEWFLGSMTNWNPRRLDVPLDFLGKGSYVAEIYQDGQDSDLNPKRVLIEKATVTNDQVLNIQLTTAGGCAIRFKPED